MKADLILGCHGQMKYKMVMCSGSSNGIVAFDNLPQGKEEEIFEYIDNHCKLFDKVITDTNKIGNVVSFLDNVGAIKKEKIGFIWDFISMHRRCGLWMLIEPRE